MSKMGQELEKRLDKNKYELYDVCKTTLDTIKAGFSHNPDIDSPELHVEYLYGLFQSCQKRLEKVIKSIEKG